MVKAFRSATRKPARSGAQIRGTMAPGRRRIYTLAGIIRYSMPYLNPGSLTDAEAQQVAAFITAKPRPRYPFKERDYPSSKIPSDAVYYNRQ